MINEESLTKLYNNVLEEKELTTKELNSLGFNSKDLKDLIDQEKIIRVRRGLYSLKSVDDLFYYGKTLIAQKEYAKADLCFQKCFELDPRHKGVAFRLFLKCINEKDYKKAFVYYDIFQDSENEFYNIDCNYYLYLLNMITDIPEKYQEYAKYLEYDDIRVDYNDKRYENIPKQNKMRLSALNQRFSLALLQLNELIRDKGSIKVQDLLIKNLLIQALDVQNKNRKEIINLIKQKQYQDIIDFYKKREASHRLSISESYVYILTKDLLNINKTKIIPEIQEYNTNDFFNAIDGQNYELALDLIKKKNAKFKVSNDDSIYLLLVEIVNSCNNIRKSAKKEQKTSSINNLENNSNQELREKTKPIFENNPVKENKVKEAEPTIKKADPSLANIITYLMKGDLENSLKFLRTYLNSLNKSDYEFLIIDLIKISLLEKDITFTKPMMALTLVSKDNYSFDIATYIQEFYIKLSQDKLAEARVYLDIITKGNKLGQDCVITDGLYQILEISEKMLDNKQNNKELEIFNIALENNQKKDGASLPNFASKVEPKKEKEERTRIQKPTIKEEPKKEKEEVLLPQEEKIQVQEQRTEIPKEEMIPEKDNLKKYIDKKYAELLVKKSIILLNPMPENKIKRIMDMMENYKDMVAFVIGEGNEQQVVLRYKPKIQGYVNGKELINLGNKAYSEGNYNECIEKYLQLLQMFKSPRAIVYAKLGFAYTKKYQKKIAIEYLTVANSLAKQENLPYDYQDLIMALKGEIDVEDRKPIFKMLEEDFDYNKLVNYYGFNFPKINDFIIESGLDVETASLQLGLTLEEANIIKLIYAREFYMQGINDKGDIFLNSVEKSKNKSEKTKKILEEVRKNKRFYQYRKDDNNMELVLSLLPKKK